MPSLVTATPEPPSATLPPSSLAAAGAASDATARGGRNARRRPRRARRGGRTPPANCRAIVVVVVAASCARARARRGCPLGFCAAGGRGECCGGEARDLFGQEMGRRARAGVGRPRGGAGGRLCVRDCLWAVRDCSVGNSDFFWKILGESWHGSTYLKNREYANLGTNDSFPFPSHLFSTWHLGTGVFLVLYMLSRFIMLLFLM